MSGSQHLKYVLSSHLEKCLLNLGLRLFIRKDGGGTDLLDHDGEGTQHLESSGKVHDIAPAQHQSKGHGYHLSVYIGESHHHGHQHHEGISDTGGKKSGCNEKEARLILGTYCS